MIFILGIIVGLLIAILLVITFHEFKIPIQRNVEKFLAEPLIKGHNQAYVAGLSDEESTFLAALPMDKQVEIL